MEDVLKLPGLIAGYPILGLAIVMLWRLMREYRSQMEYWRDKAITFLSEAEAQGKAAKELVKVGKPARDRLNTVVDIILEHERESEATTG